MNDLRTRRVLVDDRERGQRGEREGPADDHGRPEGELVVELQVPALLGPLAQVGHHRKVILGSIDRSAEAAAVGVDGGGGRRHGRDERRRGAHERADGRRRGQRGIHSPNRDGERHARHRATSVEHERERQPLIGGGVQAGVLGGVGEDVAGAQRDEGEAVGADDVAEVLDVGDLRKACGIEPRAAVRHVEGVLDGVGGDERGQGWDREDGARGFKRVRVTLSSRWGLRGRLGLGPQLREESRGCRDDLFRRRHPTGSAAMESASVMTSGSSRERRCGRIGAAEDAGGGAGGHVAAVGSRPRARECGVWTTLED